MSRRVEVPLLDLRPQYAAIREEIDGAIARVVTSQRFVLGPEVEALEAEIAAYCGSSHAIACASGSDAVLLALLQQGIGPGDEVLCPSYTFFSTASSITRMGARPVFVDLDPTTYNLDPVATRKVAARCRQLRAILPVHLFGQVADLPALLELGDELGAPVLEDSAQALGARDAEGRRAGTVGVVGCFSFYPTKNLGAFGDGGILTTDDRKRASELAILRVHGGQTRYHHSVVGINSRLDALQAAVLRVKLRHLDTWTARRRAHAAYYDAAFAERGAHDSSVPLAQGGLPLRTPKPPDPPAEHVYHQYVIRVPARRRDSLRGALAAAGIGTEVFYPLGLHQQQCFADLGYRPGDLPQTESAAQETLALPIFPELTTTQLDWVIEAVHSFLRD